MFLRKTLIQTKSDSKLVRVYDTCPYLVRLASVAVLQYTPDEVEIENGAMGVQIVVHVCFYLS